MRMIFRAAGWLTLLVDAYLMLALIAIKMMKVEYLYLLPPFDSDLAITTPRSVYFGLVFWTGILAVGCLYSTKPAEQTAPLQGEEKNRASTPELKI